MVQIPLWGRIMVLFVVLLGLYTAAPNFWPRAVPILNEDGTAQLDDDGNRLVDCAVPAPFACRQINLGLDLQGGAFASFEIDEQDYWRSFFEDIQFEIEQLSDSDDALFFGLLLDDLTIIDADDGGLIASFTVLAEATAEDIRTTYIPSVPVLLSQGENGELQVQVTGTARAGTMNNLTDRLVESLRNRFDAFGISEPSIREAGPAGRVNVEIPGGTEVPTPPPGNLRLCSVPGNFTTASGPQYVYLDAQRPGSFDVQGATRIAIDRTVQCIETSDFTSAAASLDGPNVQVNVQLRPGSASIMNDLTSELFSQSRFLAVILDDEVIRMDSFEPNLGTSFRIRGVQTLEEAQNLAKILESGALPAKIKKLTESKVGSELGEAAARAGQVAAVLAVVAVLIYMVVSYGLFGLFANIALVVNLSLILGIMSLLGFTLSLPGIAGIVLTIGMAVDANVLVFERMREVWRKTENVGQAIENGYAQALSTILDANITTFIAALVLFFVGKGAIQGFAVTLSIGIVTSIFCALALTRMLIGFWFGTGRRLSMPI